MSETYSYATPIDVRLLAAHIGLPGVLTERESRALSTLTAEWADYDTLKGVDDWGVFDALAQYGRAEERITSPYTVSQDGKRLYQGSRHAFRLAPESNEE